MSCVIVFVVCVVIFVCFSIVSLTTDVMCVVMRFDRSRCQVLNVLFAGTSHGRILKMFVGGLMLPNVIAEEVDVSC